jgi:hypothetical protein
VPGRRLVGVDGVDAGVFVALSQVNAAFPVGVDAWLLDGDGALVGLPRSAAIRVVHPTGSIRTGSDRRGRAATGERPANDLSNLSKGT